MATQKRLSPDPMVGLGARLILTVTLTKIHKEVQINTVVCACVLGMLTARLLLRKKDD